MTHIFISYAKNDSKNFATVLEKTLNAMETITAWMDYSLESGDSWAAQIEKEILRCDYFVVLLSPDVNRHREGKSRSFVLNEISFAKNENKIIIPVMVDMTSQPIEIAGIQYIDATQSINQGTWKVVEDICIRIGISSPERWTSLEIVWPNNTTMVTLPIASEENNYEEPYALAIAKYPVTNQQYKIFTEETGYPAPVGDRYIPDKGWEGPFEPWKDPNYSHPDQPVVCVNLFDALNYCSWLNTKLIRDKIVMPSREIWALSHSSKWASDLTHIYSDFAFLEFDGEPQQTIIVNKYYPETTSINKDRINYWGISDLIGNIWEWGTHPERNEPEIALDITRYTSGLIFGRGSFLDQKLAFSPLSGTRLTQGYLTKHADLGFRHAGLIWAYNLPNDFRSNLHTSPYYLRYSNLSEIRPSLRDSIIKLTGDLYVQSSSYFPHIFTQLLLNQTAINIFYRRER